MIFKPLVSIILMLQLASFNSAYAAENDVTIVPDSISDTVSDIDMRLRLATKPNAAPCAAENCIENQNFDARVQQAGALLIYNAYILYPALLKRVPQFSFSVLEKVEPGSASNGAGKVVLFRGVQQLQLDDNALSFVLAREIGHVIGKHHNKNISTKLLISALASVAFPALAIISASSAAAQATTATTLLTSAASTATSMLGSEVALAKMKPSQLTEADDIALNLLSAQEWDLRSTANLLQFDEVTQNNWMQDLQLSNATLLKMLEQEDLAVVALDDDYIVDSDVEHHLNDGVEIHALEVNSEAPAGASLESTQ